MAMSADGLPDPQASPKSTPAGAGAIGPARLSQSELVFLAVAQALPGFHSEHQ
jgi:hypothetical protein